MSLTFVSNSNRYEIRFHKDANTEQLGKSFSSIKQALSYVKRIYITEAENCGNVATILKFSQMLSSGEINAENCLFNTNQID